MPGREVVSKTWSEWEEAGPTQSPPNRTTGRIQLWLDFCSFIPLGKAASLECHSHRGEVMNDHTTQWQENMDLSHSAIGIRKLLMKPSRTSNKRAGLSEAPPWRWKGGRQILWVTPPGSLARCLLLFDWSDYSAANASVLREPGTIDSRVRRRTAMLVSDRSSVEEMAAGSGVAKGHTHEA